MSANTPPDLPSGNPPPQSQSGFNVPPTGGAPSLPENSHQYPGQKPGYVPQQPKQQEQVPEQNKAPQQPAAGLDLASILQAALTGQQPAQAPAAPELNKPNWIPGSVNEFDVDTIDDPIIKSMASVLKVAGKDLDLNRVLGNALAFGDPNLVDVAYIAEKGGANAQQLAEIAKGIVQAVEAKSTAIMTEVHAMVGGEAQWSQSAAVFNQSAPPELRMTVQTMLDSTNPAYIKAGAKIVAEFGRASGRLPQAGSGLLNGASAGLGAASGLSAAEFKAALFKLDSRQPGFKEAREDLFARRALGKRAGM